ncbi:methanol oxidase [Grimontia sp. NTOU-MAR1]|uniref:methanol oxidase n=1 Tax=Grimontia sp. NTOU-MAR1 TaxID=3111011 RepID=UPI002DBEA881|nr:methanol oxidase [Grimontia sp. NTOU-MAR1]WRW00093.1 methanol oxidase [Grimontia sp. NTOU-MAR1]
MIEWHVNALWHHTDSCRRFGVEIGNRMTVFRLKDGTLLVHNPSELTANIREHLTKLGTVSCVTTANQRLHQSLSDWWLSFPEAFFFSAPGLAAKRTDLGFDGVLNSTTSPLWRGQLYQTVIRGNDSLEEVVFCDPVSRTLILGESLWLLSEGALFKQLAGRLLGCGKDANVPLLYQLQVKELKLLRQSLQEILTWPFDHILPVHGDPILFDGKKKLAAAYLWAFHSDNNL